MANNDTFSEYFAALRGNETHEPGAPDDRFGAYLAAQGKSAGPGPGPAAPAPQAAPAEDRQPVPANPQPPLYDLAVVGGQVVLPEYGVLETNVYVKDGRVAVIGGGAVLPAAQVVRAQGKYVLPGIIDPHIHMGIADTIASELETESVSAILGGVTTAGLFVSAPEANAASLEDIAENVRRVSHINILPHFVIGQREQIGTIPMLVRQFGLRSFKVYLHGVPGLIDSQDDAFVLDVMQALKNTGEHCVLCVHTENHALVTRATEQIRARVGNSATMRDWAETHPEIAEEEAVMRMAYFAKKLEQDVYLVHISTRGAVERLREIRRDNPYVIVETTSPYLSLSLDGTSSPAAKMEPPIRDSGHVEALWQGVADGTVDSIGTDNVSWNRRQKNFGGSIWDVNSGYPAMGTHVPCVLTEGVFKRGLDLTMLVGKMTMGPAKAFDIYPQKGTLLPGSDADITLVDMNTTRKVDPGLLRSRAEYSIHEGRSFTGWPVMTIQGGTVVMADGELVDRPKGRLIV